MNFSSVPCNADLTSKCATPLRPFYWLQLDEYGRMVYDEEVRPPPTSVEEQEPFWEGWSADKLGLNGEEVRSSSICKQYFFRPLLTILTPKPSVVTGNRRISLPPGACLGFNRAYISALSMGR